jgi:hypothetical protein
MHPFAQSSSSQVPKMALDGLINLWSLNLQIVSRRMPHWALAEETENVWCLQRVTPRGLTYFIHQSTAIQFLNGVIFLGKTRGTVN